MNGEKNNKIYFFSIVVSLILGVTIVGSTIGIVALKLQYRNPSSESVAVTNTEAVVVSGQNETTALMEETINENPPLNANCDWASLYYEMLNAIDGADKKTCALIYINNDDVPELFITSEEDRTRHFLINISENGLFTQINDVFANGDFLYRERTGSCCTRSKHNNLSGHFFYSFDGKELTIIKHNNTAEKEVTSAEFDFSTASQPNTVSVSTMLNELAPKRQITRDTSSEYSGDSSELVSTYLDMETQATVGETTANVVYRIPQINLEGSDIERVNREILNNYEKIANNTKETGKTSVTLIDYQVYCNNGILSLIITFNTVEPDSFSQTIYNFDISGQREISNQCLLNSYGYISSAVMDAFKSYERQKCNEEMNNNPKRGTEYYDRKYQYAVDFFSPSGNQMYFDDSGTLNVIYKEQSDAGAADNILQAKLQLNNQLKGWVTSEYDY